VEQAITWNPLKTRTPRHWSRLGPICDTYHSQRYEYQGTPLESARAGHPHPDIWNEPQKPYELQVLHLRPPGPAETNSMGFGLSQTITLYTTVCPEWFWLYRQVCPSLVKLPELTHQVHCYSIALRKRECLQVWMGSWDAMPCIHAVSPREYHAKKAAEATAERFGRFVQSNALLKACIQLQGLTPTNDSDPERTKSTRAEQQDWTLLTFA